VYIQADDILSVLLSGQNVHIHVGKAGRNQRAGLDLNWDLDCALRKRERQGLHGDFANTQWEVTHNILGAITLARAELCTKSRHSGREMCRGHNFITASSSNDGLSCTSLDGLGLDVGDCGVLGTTVRPCDCQSAGLSNSLHGLSLLRCVYIQADDILSVLLSGQNVHIHVGKAGRNQRAGLDLNWDLDCALRKRERQGLHGDFANTHWEVTHNILGAITLA